MNTGSSRTFSTLSPDLHLEDFSCLDPVSSTCLGLTCKAFYSIHRAMHGTVALTQEVQLQPGYRIPEITHDKEFWLFLLTWIGMHSKIDGTLLKIIRKDAWVNKCLAAEQLTVGKWMALTLNSAGLTEGDFRKACCWDPNSIESLQALKRFHDTRLSMRLGMASNETASIFGSVTQSILCRIWEEEQEEENHRITFGHYRKRDYRYTTIFGSNMVDWS